MAHFVDARGLSCPQPVILTIKALNSGFLPVEVTVDNEAAAENVKRAAENAGYHVNMAQLGHECTLNISKKQ